MTSPPVTVRFSILALTLGATSVFAGSSVPPTFQPQKETIATTFVPRFVMGLGAQYEVTDDSSAGPSGDIIRGRATIPFLIPLNGEWRLLGMLRGGFSDYESDPFDGSGFQTWNVGALVMLDGQLNDQWSITFGALGGASWEDGASFSDSLNGGGLVLAGYQFSPKLKVGVGGLYLTRTNEDALAFPALGLDWQASENLKVTLQGLDLRAELTLSDDWSVFVRGEYDPNGALLKDRDNTEADSFDDQGFLAAGGVTWTPCPQFSLSLEGGLAFHEYTLRNDGEEILAKDRLDPAPFVGVSARLAF